MKDSFLKKISFNWSYFLLIFIVTLWTGVFFILPDFIDNPVSGFKGFVVAGMHWALICFTSFFLIYLASINRIAFSVFLPVFFLLGSVIGFFRYHFKATVTPMIVDATLNNDMGTTMDLISLNLILFVLFNLAVSGIFVWYRYRKITVIKGWLHLFISVLLLLLPFNISYRVKSSINQRFPFNVAYSLSEYIELQKAMNVVRVDFEPDFECNSDKLTDSLIVVFVIGESARADHFSLNGYERKTNPRLEKRSGIYSFPYVYSDYTYTNRSVPHILTRADSVHADRAFNEKSFISLFSRCNFKTSWISNQDPASSYISLMNECDTIIYAHPEKSVYNYNEWLDEDLFPFIKNKLDYNHPRNLLILHTIGSHWYYNNHFTAETTHFKPVTRSRIINHNSAEEIINSYDNTIVYTDFFLDSLISMISHRNAILIYLSDHGEALGEDGHWLHASNHPIIRNTASLIWLSDSYREMNPEVSKILQKNRLKSWRTDFLFHSILSAAGIPSASIDGSLDVFSIKNQQDLPVASD